MATLRERIERRIRDEICHVCLYERADGGCNQTLLDLCPIVAKLDEVIAIVRATDSDAIDPYVERLRETVCGECDNQGDDGHCGVRDRADCPLDDYFVLVVEIVEQELARADC